MSVLRFARTLLTPMVRPVLRKCSLELRSFEPKRFCRESTDRPYCMRQRFQELSALGLHRRTFVDGGANRGTVSEVFLVVFPGAACQLFEPLAQFHPGLERLAGRSTGSRLFRGVLSAAPGTATLNVDATDDPDLVTQNLNREATGSTTAQQVEAFSLDDLIGRGEIPVPDVVKLDVEGHELEVFQGAPTTFDHTEAYLLEVSFWGSVRSPDFAEVVAFMAERDYVAYDFAGLLRRKPDSAPLLVDVLFVRRNGFLRQSASWS